MSDHIIAYTNEEIKKIAQKQSLEELPQTLSTADENFLGVFIKYLVDHHVHDWRQKLFSVIEQLTQVNKLEMIGSALNTEQVIELLHLFAKQLLPIAKLFPLIVGMQQRTFEEVLCLATPSHLKVLENENLKEPIQHHLKLFSLKESAQLKDQYVNLELLEKKIKQMKVENLDFKELYEMEEQLKQQQVQFEKHFEHQTKALRLAWICGRTDIIETLSENHEICDKILKSIFGSHQDYSSENIYQKLNEKLEEVFKDPFAEKNNKNDPAIEGVMHFPIHLQDYWNLGLIPGHEDTIAKTGHLSIQQLAVDQIDHLENIYEEIQHNLEKRGLKTIADLEHHKIYSKYMLYEYLKKYHKAHFEKF